MKKIFLLPILLLFVLASCKKCYDCQTYVLTENFTELNIPDNECGEYKSPSEAVNATFDKYDRRYPNALILEVDCIED